MDKRTIIGIILIVLITLMMPYYYKWVVGEQPVSPPPPQSEEMLPAPMPEDTTETIIPAEKPPEEPAQPTVKNEVMAIAGIDTSAPVKHIVVKSNLINTTLTTQHGGNFTDWELLNYDYYLGGNVNLATPENGLDLELMDRNGKTIQLFNYTVFTNISSDTIFLDESHPTQEVEFYLPINNGVVKKKYVFHYNSYSMDVVVSLENLQDFIINRRYYFKWKDGLPSTEENIKEDYTYARAFVYQAGELDNIDASEDEVVQEDYTGRVDWTAIRTKYFLAAVIPANPKNIESASLIGRAHKENDILHKYYSALLEVPFPGYKTQLDTFTVYLGPLDYGILKKYNADLETLVMNRDWYERIFRPISLLILPAFKFLYGFIPNYGLVIIIFSILIKLILHPLTKKSYQSMSEMQYLQPKMTQLKEQYKNDPQRLNQEMMKLYKEHGVNPLGGCLPMFLQMPLLFALFIVFRSTIQLRGQPFILWITDLSRPDTLALGFSLPFIGDTLHVLPLLMGLTMIWQSKMTITDPKQKFMMYFMPVFMIFIFYSLPSGLNLYYSVFNLLSMIQTRMIKKKMHPNNSEPEKATAKKPATTKRQPTKRSRKKKA